MSEKLFSLLIESLKGSVKGYLIYSLILIAVFYIYLGKTLDGFVLHGILFFYAPVGVIAGGVVGSQNYAIIGEQSASSLILTLLGAGVGAVAGVMLFLRSWPSRLNLTEENDPRSTPPTCDYRKRYELETGQ